MGRNYGVGIMVKNGYVLAILKLGKDKTPEITQNPERLAERDPL
jgi:hypothetical protein